MLKLPQCVPGGASRQVTAGLVSSNARPSATWVTWAFGRPAISTTKIYKVNQDKHPPGVSDKSWLTCVRLGVLFGRVLHAKDPFPLLTAGSFLSGSLPSTSSEAATTRTSKQCSSQMTGSEMPCCAHTTLESIKFWNVLSEIQPAETSLFCQSIFLS